MYADFKRCKYVYLSDKNKNENIIPGNGAVRARARDKREKKNKDGREIIIILMKLLQECIMEERNSKTVQDPMKPSKHAQALKTLLERNDNPIVDYVGFFSPC